MTQWSPEAPICPPSAVQAIIRKHAWRGLDRANRLSPRYLTSSGPAYFRFPLCGIVAIIMSYSRDHSKRHARYLPPMSERGGYVPRGCSVYDSDWPLRDTFPDQSYSETVSVGEQSPSRSESGRAHDITSPGAPQAVQEARRPSLRIETSVAPVRNPSQEDGNCTYIGQASRSKFAAAHQPIDQLPYAEKGIGGSAFCSQSTDHDRHRDDPTPLTSLSNGDLGTASHYTLAPPGFEQGTNQSRGSFSPYPCFGASPTSATIPIARLRARRDSNTPLHTPPPIMETGDCPSPSLETGPVSDGLNWYRSPYYYGGTPVSETKTA